MDAIKQACFRWMLGGNILKKKHVSSRIKLSLLKDHYSNQYFKDLLPMKLIDIFDN